jgi:SAM-dependent methyltransferase
MESPYGTTERPEIHSVIPPDARRILDVGCNDGGFAGWLKRQVPDRLVMGVEPNPVQAAKARDSCDLVVVDRCPQALSQIEGDFDCITFNHVLEHMTDPWEALRRTKGRLAQNGCVVAVIPNTRYVSLLFDLVFRGRWQYQRSGLLDRTHLRLRRSSRCSKKPGCRSICSRGQTGSALSGGRWRRSWLESC